MTENLDLVAADVRALAPDAPIEAIEAVVETVRDGYCRADRHYHTLGHARRVRDDAVEVARRASIDEPLLPLAAWFHDVVFERSVGVDERRSADLLEQALSSIGRDDLRERAHHLVMATVDHQIVVPVDPAGALVDADLGVLAGDDRDYADYLRNVRLEYAHVDDAVWRRGRSAVIEALLRRERLYTYAVDREARARHNLTAELATLQG